MKCRYIDKKLVSERGLVTYWVDLQIPWLARGVQIDNDFFIVEAEFLKGNVRAVSPGAEVVRVENDLWGGHDGLMWDAQEE